ncbi:MAG: LptE family protein [Desulfobacterales bacterium]|nr:LptE family protein [Desulfobacterales bacterium]
MRRYWIGWLVFVLMISGCGYRLTGGGALPKDVKQVFVAMFENRTDETGAESILTNDLIYEFTRNGTLAGTEHRADARLAGVIESVSKGTISRISTNTSQERRVSLVVSLRLTGSDGTLLWSKRMSDNEVFLVEIDRETTDRNRRAAVRKLSKRLAEKAYYRLTDQF